SRRSRAAAAPTATSSARSGCPSWTASAPRAAVPTRPTSTFSSPRCRFGHSSSPRSCAALACSPIVSAVTNPWRLRMAVQAGEREMISERIAPGMLPRVLNSFDMTIIFVAIVLFIVNASAIQQAHQAAYTYWIIGFLAFLIPGALVTAQLGRMFPQEGSLYVWTQKALGPFWGFFAGFCAWWPGILVMVATGDAVVTLWQFVDTGGLPKAWEQGLVILAVLWFSAFMSMLRLR